jgi:hypothetical protein
LSTVRSDVLAKVIRGRTKIGMIAFCKCFIYPTIVCRERLSGQAADKPFRLHLIRVHERMQLSPSRPMRWITFLSLSAATGSRGPLQARKARLASSRDENYATRLEALAAVQRRQHYQERIGVPMNGRILLVDTKSH